MWALSPRGPGLASQGCCFKRLKTLDLTGTVDMVDDAGHVTDALEGGGLEELEELKELELVYYAQEGSCSAIEAL